MRDLGKKNPPPEGYLIASTVSSWRRKRSSAVEAGEAFLAAANRNHDLVIEIEETMAAFYSVTWVYRETADIPRNETKKNERPRRKRTGYLLIWKCEVPRCARDTR